MWGPSAPSIAGSRVAAAKTATTTAIAAVKPSVVTSGMPAKASEQRAMTTVKPAKTTAPPAVAVARADRLAQLHPFRHLQFVAGDDEQRVVDPDPEPDHRRQGRGDPRDLDRVLEQADDRERAGEADHGGDDRQHHRRRGAEGEEQDDHRGGEADRLADLGRGLGELLADVAADGGVQAGGPRRRGGVEDPLRLGFVEFSRPLAEDDREVADLLVLAEEVGTGRAGRAGRRVDERDRFQALLRFGDGGRVLGFGQLARGRFHHQRVAAVGLFGQVFFQQFRRHGRAGAGERQVFAGLAAGGLADRDKGDREHEPDGDDGVVMARAEPTDGVEGAGHWAIIPYGAGVVPFSNGAGTVSIGLAPSRRRSRTRCWA